MFKKAESAEVRAAAVKALLSAVHKNQPAMKLVDLNDKRIVPEDVVLLAKV